MRAGLPESEEAQQLPSLQAARDVQLLTEDGGCFPAHACLLEINSRLLGDALREDAQQAGQGELLQLRIPQLTSTQLLSLLGVTYKERPYSAIQAMTTEDVLALAEATHLLGCNELLRQADVILLSRADAIIDKATAVERFVWASKHGAEQLKDKCVAYIAANLPQLDLSAQQDAAHAQILMPILLKLQQTSIQLQEASTKRTKGLSELTDELDGIYRRLPASVDDDQLWAVITKMRAL